MLDVPAHIKEDTDDVFKQIMRKTVLSQSGEVSKLMCRMGIINKLNYGVPVTTLRQIANQFSPNHELAMKLWQQEIREAKILASMLTQPEKLLDDEIEFIIKSVDNLEFAELFGRDIFNSISQVSFLDVMIDGNQWQGIAAIYGVGWSVRQQKNHAGQSCDWFFANIDKIFTKEIPEFRQPVIFAMQCIASINDSYKCKMFEVAKNYSKSNHQFGKRIGDEYLWLCENVMCG
jgi:hypothetical protein